MEEGLLEQKKGATNPTSSSDLQNTKTQLSCDSRRQCPSCNTVFRMPPPKPQLSIHFRNSTDRMRTALSSNLSACKDTRHKTHLQRHKDSTRNSSSCRTDRVFLGGRGERMLISQSTPLTNLRPYTAEMIHACRLFHPSRASSSLRHPTAPCAELAALRSQVPVILVARPGWAWAALKLVRLPLNTSPTGFYWCWFWGQHGAFQMTPS